MIVDEVGYAPIDRQECNLFYRFVVGRYEKASAIINANKAFSDWSELFHGPVIVTAVLDRLLHHSIVTNIKGNSYRLKDKNHKQADKPCERSPSALGPGSGIRTRSLREVLPSFCRNPPG